VEKDMSVKPIPDGYHAVTPYLVVPDVAKQIEFLEKAFDAKVLYRMDTPNGTTHAEVKIRDSILMMGQASGEHKPMPGMMYLYVEDADEAFQKAKKAGGEVVQPMKDQFYGDRSGGLKDSNGNQWWVASRKEELTPEEVSKRAREAYAHKA
jgi:PhnB protein